MRVRVLVWATTFGADLFSFTRYLDRREDVETRVVLDDPAGFREEGVWKLFPLRAELVARTRWRSLAGVRGFRPDVLVFDHRLPLRTTARAGLALWHGFGWKGPNDEQELGSLHRAIARAWGSAKAPNPRFRWQCFGPWDLEHRSQVSAFHLDNCRAVGAASHDDLRVPLDRVRARPFYRFDVASRPTVLFAPTWHYGEVFAHWGRDAELFERLLRHCGRRGADVVLRLHDSYRFPRRYVRFLRGLQTRHAHVMVKFKNEHPDNLLDLQVADVLVTNYSSIANLFYATRRPTIHVYPVASADEAFLWRRYTALGVRSQRVSSARYVWKLSPEEHGGLQARSFGELLEQIDQALDDPACCRARAQAFLDSHMMGADGRACERAWRVLDEVAAR